ncbi:MAG: O-antigen ligase family protein [Lachnospiraceae bacterium]|nr:O-antigen ligase family protein [Lachnospiraceae bacterium]
MALVQYALFFYALYFILREQQRAYSPVFWMIVIALVVEYIATASNPYGESHRFMIMMIQQIGVWAFIDRSISRKGKSFVRNYANVLMALVLVNFITVLLFPEGMYSAGAYSRNYFLGYDNTHINIQLPAIAMMALSSEDNKREKKYYLLCVIVLISALITFSATSVISLSVFVLGMIVIHFGKEKMFIKKILFPKIYVSFCVFAGISFSIIAGTLLLSVGHFFVEVFHKDLTLSSRTLIWANSLAYIEKSPIIGYGYELPDVINSQLVNIAGQVGWGGSTHSFYLWILFLGGAVLMACVSIIILIINRQVEKGEANRPSQIIKLWFLVVLMMGLVEAHYDSAFFLMLIVSYNISHNYNISVLKTS